jgi:hypothetical protein
MQDCQRARSVVLADRQATADEATSLAHDDSRATSRVGRLIVVVNEPPRAPAPPRSPATLKGDESVLRIHLVPASRLWDTRGTTDAV